MAGRAYRLFAKSTTADKVRCHALLTVTTGGGVSAVAGSDGVTCTYSDTGGPGSTPAYTFVFGGNGATTGYASEVGGRAQLRGLAATVNGQRASIVSITPSTGTVVVAVSANSAPQTATAIVTANSSFAQLDLEVWFNLSALGGT